MPTIEEVLEEIENGLEDLAGQVEKIAIGGPADEFSDSPVVFIPGERGKDGSRRFYHPDHPKVGKPK